VRGRRASVEARERADPLAVEKNQKGPPPGGGGGVKKSSGRCRARPRAGRLTDFDFPPARRHRTIAGRKIVLGMQGFLGEMVFAAELEAQCARQRSGGLRPASYVAADGHACGLIPMG